MMLFIKFMELRDWDTPRDVFALLANVFAVVLLLHAIQIGPINAWTLARTAFQRQRSDLILELLEINATN